MGAFRGFAGSTRPRTRPRTRRQIRQLARKFLRGYAVPIWRVRSMNVLFELALQEYEEARTRRGRDWRAPKTEVSDDA